MEKKTPLHDAHVSAGARMVPFAGFQMPIQYSGILDEHRAVRQTMGMFDLSHMGELRVTGRDAVPGIDRLVTNDVSGLAVGQVRYTPMCYPEGGIVDDLLVYNHGDHVVLVVNASNIEKDLTWIKEHLEGDVRIDDVSDETALIAVQGPRASRFLQTQTDVDVETVAYYYFTTGRVCGVPATISRTGYTGEDGFELYVRPEDAPQVWQTLAREGASQGLKPVGLGARDTLRLEAGYMLYGNDIDDSTTPLEAGLGWTVKFGAVDFVGRAVLEQQKSSGVQRRMVQLELLDRAIPRPHHAVQQHGEPAGEITSGTFSPTFNRGIALGYVRTESSRPATELEVEIRQQLHPARVVRKPMYRREGA